MIQNTACRHVSWVTVISKDDHLILLSFVAYKVEALLDIADYDTIAYAVDAHDEVGNVLCGKGRSSYKCLYCHNVLHLNTWYTQATS